MEKEYHFFLRRAVQFAGGNPWASGAFLVQRSLIFAPTSPPDDIGPFS